MIKICISDFKKIGEILDLIHDKWFNKKDIHFNSGLSILEIKFERENQDEKKLVSKKLFIKKWTFPIVESILRIKYVEDYCVKDEANIERYDFNEIEYDEKERNMFITSGFPLVIKIKVKKIEIEVEDTDKIIKEKSILSL